MCRQGIGGDEVKPVGTAGLPPPHADIASIDAGTAQNLSTRAPIDVRILGIDEVSSNSAAIDACRCSECLHSLGSTNHSYQMAGWSCEFDVTRNSH